MTRLKTRLASVLGMTLALSLLAVDAADARRGGSFGSRGARTYQAPRPTQTAPQPTAPVQRSMTPPTTAGAPAAAPAAAGAAAAQAPGRRGFFGGLGGGILGGLAVGGLLGMMMGHGWGGMGAGLGNTLLQLALLGGGVWLLIMLFRRRRDAQPAGFPREAAYAGASNPFGGDRGFEPSSGGAPRTAYTPRTESPLAAPAQEEIGLTQADRDAFERLLTSVQDAFGREDYSALRTQTTPEIMSYLSEELSQNATHGRRNEVSATKLLQADVAEAWREGEVEYATTAMRYESIDVMRDRQSGALISGDANAPTETTELWTFVRQGGQPWKLSAIQEA